MPEGLSIGDLRVTLSDRDRHFELRAAGLEIRAGEVCGLSGASGTGKTLLLELLGLLRRPDLGGSYVLRTGEGRHDLAGLWALPDGPAEAARLRGRYLGFVPQTGGLLPFLTLAENVELAQRIARRPDPPWRAHLLDRLGLAPYARMFPGTLSIGQRQRVAIARALAHRPRFVLADEPTAALDPENAGEAMRLLIETAREGGAAVLVSSHDAMLLDRFAMRRFRMETGSRQPGHVTSRLCRAERAAA